MSVLSFHAFCGSVVVPSEKIVNMGVLTFDDALIGSSNLGSPKVTFLAELPALWNVFKVICVVGSPTDCAAMVPTISPAATMPLYHFLIRIAQIRSRAVGEHLSVFLPKTDST